MRFTSVLLFFFLLSGSLLAQDYSRVKINLQNHDIHDVAALGVEVEHGHFKKHKYFINDFSRQEIILFEEAGIPYEILIPDVKKYYADQEVASLIEEYRPDCGPSDDIVNVVEKYDTPENYEYGTMGGYLTYEQFLEQLDLMYEKYPNLITPKMPIGDFKTHEGRDIYHLRISNNPMVDENKPEILYTSLHHAREPNSLSQLIFYMWYILENYETDEQIQFLINNTEMYFIPMINPDGYVYNQTIDPNGGGLWRKNRRDNGDGSFGVDLNRNYAYNWGLDDVGSSPNPSSDVYRGPEPFSEPETQAVRSLVNDHEFRITLNYHSFSNVLIHPWGYADEYTEDDHVFKGLANVITQENAYPYGTAFETIGYNANGNSDDWFYAGDTKPKVFAMTPEVGPGLFGFWPAETAIDELNKFCVLQNISAANLLHYYLDLTYDDEKSIEPEGNIGINLHRWGLQDGSATLRLEAVTEGLTVDNTIYTANLLFSELAEYDFEYVYDLDPDAPKADVVFNAILDYGEYEVITEIKKIIQNGDFVPVVSDVTSSLDGWSATGAWDVTEEDFVSAPVSITDSPNDEYDNNQETEVMLDAAINLSGFEDARLEFYAKWDIEDEYDFVQILVAGDNGSFEAQCGLYTNDGSNFQEPGEPLYDGTQLSWVKESIDLSEFLGQTIQIKFRFVSDQFVQGDGFYFDDLQVVSLLPVGTAEVNGATVLDMHPVPASDQLHINYKGSATVNQVSVVDPMGKVIWTSDDFESSVQLTISDWSQGTYVTMLQLADGSIVRKKWLKVQ